MKTFAILFVSMILATSACTKTKAPGTNPSDMTAEQHRDACIEHKKMAARDEQHAKDLDGGKGTYTAQVAAADHNDVANQHGDAAKQVDPNTDCN